MFDLVTIGLEAVNPYDIVIKNIHYDSSSQNLLIAENEYDLSNKEVKVIGAGKAVGRMAEAIERILFDLPLSGIISVPEGVKRSVSLKKIHCVESTHPIPTEINIQNTQQTLEYISDVSSDDFVIALISGGGSALWTAPIPPIMLEDLADLNLELLHSGMSIHEINIIRKHVSRIKGGQAAQMIPAPVIVLLLSDVIGDKIESIASGPFTSDPSTFNDAMKLLEEYDVLKNGLPDTVNEVISQGCAGIIPETPKPNNQIFSQVHHFLLGSNTIARQAIYNSVKQFGFRVINNKQLVEEDAKVVGSNLAKLGMDFIREEDEPVLFISGGEPIVKVKGNGIGGRNQEVVAAFLKELSSLDSSPDLSFLSFGSDGIDGNSEFAGAICDKITIETYQEKNISIDTFQENNDLTKFFLKQGRSLILLGPTGTNVMDLHLLLINSSKLGNFLQN